MTPTLGSGRDHTRPQKRALAATRRTDHGQQPRLGEPAPQRFHLGLAPKEVLGIVLPERRKTRVWLQLLGAVDAQGDLLEGTRQLVRRCESFRRLLRHRRAQYLTPGGLGQPGRLRPHTLPHVLPGRVLLHSTRVHHLGQYHTCRVDVGPAVHSIAARLLRSHVRRCA